MFETLKCRECKHEGWCRFYYLVDELVWFFDIYISEEEAKKVSKYLVKYLNKCPRFEKKEKKEGGESK